ncbi:MAG: hypothetical protein AABZ06_05245 [Bdellovibrionota bacterium]
MYFGVNTFSRIICCIAILFAAMKLAMAEPPKTHVLKAPCIDRKGHLRTCGKVIQSKDLNDLGIKKKVEDRIRLQIEGYYRGCDIDMDPDTDDPEYAKINGLLEHFKKQLGSNNTFEEKYKEVFESIDSSTNKCPGRPFPLETCNMFSWPGTFNDKMREGVKSEQNHIGHYCGDYTHFDTKLRRTTCHVTPDHTSGKHEREDAFIRGAWVQALTCYHQKVQNELSSERLKIKPIKDAESPCAALAKKYDEQKRMSDTIANDLNIWLKGQKNIKDIWNCTGKETTNPNELNPDVGKHRQSACQLVTAQRNMEAMFTHLAVCEIFSRAQLSFEKFLVGPGGKGGLYDYVKKHLNTNKCRSKNKRNCSHERILERCYKGPYLRFFWDRGRRFWNDKTCG